jgi:hypothetical protein
MQQATTPKSATKNETIVERTSDRELTVTRTFDAPAHIVFEAWTKPELLKQWWAPKSFGVSLFECEQDLRSLCVWTRPKEFGGVFGAISRGRSALAAGPHPAL